MKFVLTGASGGGKSTLLTALGAHGLQTYQEVGRQIVREQIEQEGTALPWKNRTAFRNLLFDRSIRAYDSCIDGPANIYFFDRTFIEAAAYSKLIGIPFPKNMQDEVLSRLFSNPVFVCPPWQEIFVQDDERRHDFELAIKDYEVTISVYKKMGYHLVELPKVSTAKRVNFVLGHI